MFLLYQREIYVYVNSPFQYSSTVTAGINQVRNGNLTQQIKDISKPLKSSRLSVFQEYLFSFVFS